MQHQTLARLEARSRILKALAHPTRLHFVDRLALGELCVCELAEDVDADMSTISKHLAVLKEAGIVTDDRRGNRIYYRLSAPCVTNFFSCVEAVLEATERREATE